MAVSYTHLDVYKRQVLGVASSFRVMLTVIPVLKRDSALSMTVVGLKKVTRLAALIRNADGADSLASFNRSVIYN